MSEAAAEWKRAERFRQQRDEAMNRVRNLEAERDEARAEVERLRALSIWGTAEPVGPTYDALQNNERQARERAEAVYAEYRKLSSEETAIRDAQAAAMRAALEGLSVIIGREVVFPGHAHTMRDIRAALSSDAGAELLAFAQAAYRTLEASNPAFTREALALAPSWLKETP